MPTIFIDDKAYEVKAEQNLLDAALSHGVEIPYFCWHPALGSVGACRQCAVQHFKDENDKQGRTVMSCMTPCADKMRVGVAHEKAHTFRKNVAEWLMTNHPLDCPVCDEGGECHLQDMTLMTQQNYRRYRFKKRTFQNQNLGPFVEHEMNRCITCYRCVRFYGDYAGGKDLRAFASSNRVYFGRHEEGTLENGMSGNLAEICPTGVFTDKRFKQSHNRKWDLQNTPSVCQLCSAGCNILPAERYGILKRVQNRYNGSVNGYFICDRGRFGHDFVNSPTRLKASSPTNRALDSAQNMIGIGSPRASLETNFALRELVGADNFYSGIQNTEDVILDSVVQIMRDKRTHTPSLEEIEHADAVLVLGEDVTNTAARVALSIRRSAYQTAVREAEAQGIPSWNDSAIRNLANGQPGNIVTVSPCRTDLDDVACESVRLAPDEIAQLAFRVAHLLDPQAPNESTASPHIETQATRIADMLRAAKKPLIVCGTSLFSKTLVEAAANLAWALHGEGQRASLYTVLAEANTLGLKLLQPRKLADALEQIKSGAVDTALVAENDLSRRLSESDFQVIHKQLKNLVVLDAFETRTTQVASTVLASTAFTEGAGTLVSAEGRMQRYFRLLEPPASVQDSWRWLDQLGKKRWMNIDAIDADIAETFPSLKTIVGAAPQADFRELGQKLPRETASFSGRTAMYANVTMHEPKPVQDPDSPLSHSMEGFPGQPPAALLNQFWQPGWNSMQAVSFYQDEIGGHLKGGDPGVRIFDDESNQKSAQQFFPPTVKDESQDKRMRAYPGYQLFGSEERAALSAALKLRATEPYALMNSRDASALGIKSGAQLRLTVNEEEVVLPVKLDETLVSGLVMLPFGSADTSFVQFPTSCGVQL